MELLVKRAQKKDKEAFIEFMEMHKKLLYVTAKSKVQITPLASNLKFITHGTLDKLPVTIN